MTKQAIASPVERNEDASSKDRRNKADNVREKYQHQNKRKVESIATLTRLRNHLNKKANRRTDNYEEADLPKDR